MNRRQALLAALGGLTAALLDPPEADGRADETKPKSKLGIADFSYNIRKRAERAGDVPKYISDPFELLKHCHEIGAAGMQCGLGHRDQAYAKQLQRYAEQHNLFIEGSTSLPRVPQDVERFDSHLRTAGAAGAKVVRVAIGGRRYEQFKALGQFREFAERTWKSMQLAAPVAARQRIHLAIENHKDFRTPEMLAMLERLSSEYVGVCVDTGNSIALLEDPMEVVQSWAPWARSAHLKDLALCEYEDGFLLADVPLGEGLLDLAAMVGILRQARPGIRFNLEMATRDALKVPCLTETYWATLPEVRGATLARTMRYVRENARDKGTLPRVGHLSLSEQIKMEEENIRTCLRYASQRLAL